MQLYCPVLAASPYLCLYLSMIGGFIVASESATIEKYWDVTNHVVEGHDRRDGTPSVFAKESVVAL